MNNLIIIFLSFIFSPLSFSQTSFNKFVIGDIVISKINNVEILKLPNESADVLYIISKDDELVYLGEDANSYSKIKFDNKNGWIDSSFLTNKASSSNIIDKIINKKTTSKCEGENYLKWSNCTGFFVYLEGPKKGYTYQGEIINGMAHGFGKRIGPDLEYEGEFKNDHADGQGKGKYKNLGTYSGNFLKGRFHGKGVWLNINGEKYDGSWEGGMRNGTGKSINNGEQYSGGFLNDAYHGEGILIMSNGDKYIGQFKNNSFHGIGTYVPTNPFLKPKHGNWVNNQFIR